MINKTIKYLLFLCICLLFISIINQNDQPSFKEDQLRYPRVRQAFQQKEAVVKALFTEKNVPFPPAGVFLRLFKDSETLELWATGADSFVLIKTYPICDFSGTVGPKRRQGDLQLPEGFYHIDRFNPASRFHLSLGINYPNAADRVFGDKGNLGGDIFIHGACVSIGCAAMTDDRIKEIYVAAVAAKNNGQKRIPVHIFPAKMTPVTIKKLVESYADSESLRPFWENLQKGYDFFEKSRKLPVIRIDKAGWYKISTK